MHPDPRFAAAACCIALTSVGRLASQGPAWQWTRARQPSVAQTTPMAHDLARGRTVLFGVDELGNAATWELFGARWSQRPGITQPPRRGGHALAYDPQRARVVMFGGNGQFGPFADTWEYDGADWRNVTPAAGPASVYGHTMAFDYNNQRIVMFGGADNSGFVHAETWEWNGSVWTQRLPTVSPPARYLHGMCSDIARRRIVLCGGQSNATYLNDTWEWDGTNWALRDSVSPGGNWRPLSYDILRGRCVQFGGGPGFVYNDTWEWNGSVWQLRAPATRPASRFQHTLAYDFENQRTVLFGGISSGSEPLSDTWAWNGTDWQLLHGNPPRPSGGAYDPWRQVVLALGGDQRNVLEWDGAGWRERVMAAGPPPRGWSALAFDAARQRLVLFGGSIGGTAQDDLWQWDGVAWSSTTPSPRPGPRTNHAMAYDSTRQRLVTFGGAAAAETWEWDGSSWHLRQPLTSPPARYGCALAYDPARQRTVLFGGGNGLFNYLTDTWTWDGTNWLQHGPTQSPGGRQNAGMDFDPARQRIVLVGGQRGLFTYPYTVLLDDTWEWNGSQWSQQALGNAPAGGAGTLVVDPVRQRVHWFGQTHWILGPLQRADLLVAGQGCGSVGVPALRATTPSIGNPQVLVDLVGGSSLAPALLVFAFQTQSLALGGGCMLLVGSPLFTRVAATNASGFATTAFAVPNATWLHGVICHVQGAMLDPASPSGIALTERLTLTIGD